MMVVPDHHTRGDSTDAGDDVVDLFPGEKAGHLPCSIDVGVGLAALGDATDDLVVVIQHQGITVEILALVSLERRDSASHIRTCGEVCGRDFLDDGGVLQPV